MTAMHGVPKRSTEFKRRDSWMRTKFLVKNSRGTGPFQISGKTPLTRGRIRRKSHRCAAPTENPVSVDGSWIATATRLPFNCQQSLSWAIHYRRQRDLNGVRRRRPAVDGLKSARRPIIQTQRRPSCGPSRRSIPSAQRKCTQRTRPPRSETFSFSHLASLASILDCRTNKIVGNQKNRA